MSLRYFQNLSMTTWEQFVNTCQAEITLIIWKQVSMKQYFLSLKTRPCQMPESLAIRQIDITQLEKYFFAVQGLEWLTISTIYNIPISILFTALLSVISSIAVRVSKVSSPFFLTATTQPTRIGTKFQISFTPRVNVSSHMRSVRTLLNIFILNFAENRTNVFKFLWSKRQTRNWWWRCESSKSKKKSKYCNFFMLR